MAYSTISCRSSFSFGKVDEWAIERRDPPRQPPNSSASATFSPARVRLLCSQVLAAELLGRGCLKDHALVREEEQAAHIERYNKLVFDQEVKWDEEIN